MLARNWKFHTGRLLLLSTLWLFAGWLLGYPGTSLAVGSIAYGAWHIVNAWRLHTWQRGTDSEIPESLGIWADIFEHIRTMKLRNLRQQQEQISVIGEFQNLTNALPDATLVIDQGRRITWFNKAGEKLLGLKNPGDIGQVVTNLLRGSEFANWLTVWDENKESLQIRSPSNDNVWLEISAVPLRQDQLLIILRDITEVHNVEQIRKDFVENISHELRTPLTVIMGYLELLQNHASQDVTNAVQRMQSQTAQIQLLLDDLLELSRLQKDEIHGEEELVNVPAILVQLKEQATEISLGRHDLVFDIDRNLLLSGISSDLESAFRNLIVNAIKYTPDGGTVTVDWHEGPEGPRLIVSDTGIGIPKRDIPRLTERFYRVGSDRARKTGGSGLGLSIVKHALNSHEAVLSIASELGHGSSFTCRFPSARIRYDRPPASDGS